jgi:hypothetical protein
MEGTIRRSPVAGAELSAASCHGFWEKPDPRQLHRQTVKRRTLFMNQKLIVDLISIFRVANVNNASLRLYKIIQV